MTADLHLGFVQFAATEGGRNAREVDVERAWAAAVGNAIAAQPDAVLVGGDVVHHPRVGIHAVKAWRDGIRRIVEETDAHVVVVQGNHDAGRTAAVLSPIVLPDDLPRVHVVLTPRRIRFQAPSTGEQVAVACYPFTVLAPEEVYQLDPAPDADVNVLLLHAAAQTTAEGVDQLPRFYAGREALDVGREAERWDLVACGDYHDFTRLHPSRLALYPGSIERTSSNMWPEVAPKGIALCDTQIGDLRFIEHPTRPVETWKLLDFDLDPLQPAAEDVNACLGSLLERDVWEPAPVIRLLVDGFARSDHDGVDWKAVRELKDRCLHFQLDLRYADLHVATFGDRRERHGSSLEDDARRFLADEEPAVRACALQHLGIAEEAA